MEILRVTCSGDSVRKLIQYVIELNSTLDLDNQDFLFDDLTPAETSFILNETTSLIEEYVKAGAIPQRPIPVIEAFINDVNKVLESIYLNSNTWVSVEVVSLSGEVDITIQEKENAIGYNKGETLYG